MLVIVAFAMLGVLLEAQMLVVTPIAIAVAAILITVVLCLRAEQRRGLARLRASLATPYPALAATRDSSLGARFIARQH
jgi:hypothetical protein